MASLRERWSVSWDDGEPVEVTSTVAEIITVGKMLPQDEHQNGPAVQTALIYCALRREGHKLPDYRDWLLVLDNWDKLPTAVVIEGPTPAAATLPEQLLSRASQGPITEAGLNATMTEPSLPQNSFS